MSATLSFDDKASTWDADPIKQGRALAVAAALRQWVPLSIAWRALEYGCGTGLLSFALQADLGEVTLADSSPGMLTVLEEKIGAAGLTHLHPLALDLTTDPPPAERYDLIYTLLRPGGWLGIADLDREDGSFHGAGFTGHCGFDREALRAQLFSVGFNRVDFATGYLMKKATVVFLTWI